MTILVKLLDEAVDVWRGSRGEMVPNECVRLQTRQLQPHRPRDAAGAHSPPAGAGCAVTTRRLTCTTVAIITSITAAMTKNIPRASP